jgi:ADP-heptose:LPS heptosyltransferase
MNIALLKNIDRLVGRVLTVLLFPPPRKSAVQSVCTRTILIIRPGGIGDAVLLLPMLNQLSSLYPEAKTDVLAESRNAEVFEWSPAVSRVWQYDRPLDFLKLFRQRYDLIIDTEQWYRLSAVVARLLNASRLIGFATNERFRLFTDPCLYNLDEYELGMFLRLLDSLGENSLVTADFSRLMCLPPSQYRFSNPYVVLLPGSSVAAKKWPVERFAEVARYCEKKGFEVVVVGGKAEQDTSQIIVSALINGHNFAGKVSLTESASMVSGAALLISGDSGLLHVAQLQGVPTVALFGPSNSKKWFRNDGLHVLVTADSDCAPCSLFGTIPRCHYGFQCMQDITVDMVTGAVESLLQNSGATKIDCP